MRHDIDRLTRFLEPPEEEAPGVDFDYLITVTRRQWKTVAAAVIVCLALGLAYLWTAVPIYQASANILIDTSNQKIADQLKAVTGILDDEGSVLSQVEILKSHKLAISVSKRLDLIHDQQFLAEMDSSGRTVVSRIRAVFDVRGWFEDDPAPESAEDRQDEIVGHLQSNLGVYRVGRTYVLEVDFTSTSPELATRIAAAYADTYLTDQLDSKYDATRRASDWLMKRITELRQKSLETDLAVQKFRAKSGLITTDGQLVSDQQLTQINTQLGIARSDTASAQAKFNRIKSLVDSGDVQSAVVESLESAIISDLRSKYLEASRKHADISNRLGSQHVQALRLKGEMAEYQRLMFDELRRIAQSYESSYEVALTRQKSLESQVAAATGVSVSANDSQVQLRELERESETYKKLYETFLQRYQEAVQQQSFPITEARIISDPTIPDTPSAPKKQLILVLSVLAGLMLGAGLGAVREFRDRFFRTGDQIREILNLEPLGPVPLATAGAASSPWKGTASRHARVIAKDNEVANFVIDHPLSAFAETMRSAKIAIDVRANQKRPKIIGVVSVLPGEGKTTVSINFAELLASQGSRVLLIDADLRNPGATRMLGKNAERGILEVLQDNVAARDILMINPDTKLAFLPAVIKRRIPYSSELLASEAMDRIIREISEAFDYIIFDLPPLAPVVDARAMSAKLDSYLFVVEWGKTSRSVVRKTLIANAAVSEKCAGVILNKVDTDKMKYYQSYGSSEFYYSRYASYYR